MIMFGHPGPLVLYVPEAWTFQFIMQICFCLIYFELGFIVLLCIIQVIALHHQRKFD